MNGFKNNIRATEARVAKTFNHLTMGGKWAVTETAPVQNNLRNFWFDGLFANASDAVPLNYLTLYVLTLGATNAEIGLMSALGSLSATLMLLPGAMLVERLRTRKWIAVLSGGIMARMMLLLLLLTPFFAEGRTLVYAAIAFSVARDAFGNLSLPAWISLTGDLVPIKWRGRYFSSRNIAMTIASIIVTISIGELITRMDTPGGYQLALGLSFALGIISTSFFAHIWEPRIKESPQPVAALSLGEIVRPLTSSRLFLMYCLVAALWNFSLNLAGPFFNVYMVKELLLTPAIIGLLGTVSNISGLPGQRIMGPLSDRWGPYRVQRITGFLIPLLPVAWIFIHYAWQIALVNLIGGFLWAGFSLASFNLLLSVLPSEQRTRASALYQMVVSISLAAGAAIGGVLLTEWGFVVIFVVSAVGRWVAAILFARVIKPPAS